MALILLSLTHVNILAESIMITGDTADYELDESLTVGNTAGATLRCGATSATTPGGRNAIFIFALPAIGITNQVVTATLNFIYAAKSGSPAFNGDLWGVGFYASNAGITNVFLKADNDTNAANVKLDDNLLTPASATGSITSSNFSGYLQSFYTTNSGYVGGSYVFLRVNPDADPGSMIVGYNLNSADSTSKPVLTIVTTDSAVLLAPANLTAVAGNSQVALNWFAVTGATNYNLKRATFSGGPYTVTNSIMVTNFTDTGLNNSTTYFYVVSAVGTNGESADSVEANAAPFSSTFVHPGLLHAQADLDRMRQMVSQGVEPWASAFVKLSNDPLSQASYSIAWRPTTNFYVIGRGTNPGENVNVSAVENDCGAAYQLALMWYITSNSAYAQKSIQILNDWSSSLTNIIGTDAILAAGLDGPKFLNAAELLRYSNAGWSAANIAQFSAMMTNVFYPVISNFATFANGNWDGACEKTMLGIGIFCERPDLFNRATNYFYTGVGCGALTNYIYPNGQCQESGRDQTHVQLGIGQLAEVCEMAWHQGADLYGASSNRLLAGYEYTAKYNLGYSVPYTPAAFTGWSNGIWFSTTISTNYRGEMRPIYEMPYNHYVNIRGLSAPFTAQIATNILSPEGPWSAADHPGFGTLTCSLQPRAVRTNKISVATAGASSGLSFGTTTEGDTMLTGINAGDYASFNNINLTGVKSFSTRIAGSTFPGTIEVHLDSPSGTLLGTCEAPLTSGVQFWATVSCNFAPATGTHALYLVYQSPTNATLFNESWFALDKTNAFPQIGSNLLVLATNTLTTVNVGGQPAGTNLFGGEIIANNALANGYPVGTNFVIWTAANLSGNYLALTQTVVVVASADTPTGLVATPGSRQVLLSWDPATNASWYNIKQSTVSGGTYTNIAVSVAATNFTATNLTNGTLYYFVISSTNTLTESGNSTSASARPTSLTPPALAFQTGAGSLQFTWPLDHTGWRLQVQANPPGVGLGTNWFSVSGSSGTNAMGMSIAATNGCVFYRLIYP